MIAYINGTLAEAHPTHAIIEAGGLGYEVRVALPTYEKLKPLAEGTPVKLHTYQHIKEDGQALYGFMDTTERGLFLNLLGVQGVGAATALAILSALSVTEAQQAIVKEDARAIQRVKGIGAKTAQRIILDLRDKLKKEGIAAGATSGPSLADRVAGNKSRSEALSALVTLGFVRAAAEKTLDAIIEHHGPNLRVEDLIKFALKSA